MNRTLEDDCTTEEKVCYRHVRRLAEGVMDLFYGPSGLDVPLKTKMILEAAYRTLKKTAKFYEFSQDYLDNWSPAAPGVPFGRAKKDKR
jgi:hypothetical protein